MFEGNTFKKGFFQIDVSHYDDGDDGYLVYNVYFKSTLYKDGDDLDHIKQLFDFEEAVKFINAEDEFYELNYHEFKTKLLDKDFEIKIAGYQKDLYITAFFKGERFKDFSTISDAIDYIKGK